jgi:divalent metal cation (Fe/Co/Zn/Cd) transporter
MQEIAKIAKYDKLIRAVFYLSLLTIFYNIIEGIISIYFGHHDETLALLGFGIDSFVEVISGVGILHLAIRMQKNPDIAMRDKFEDTALRVTGTAFYLLTAGLVAGAGINFYTGTRPNTTIAGIIIAGISIATMYGLYKLKLNIGNKLNSEAVKADAECTKTCYSLSIVLLGASLAYELADVPYIDIVGGLGIAWFAYQSGKESFEKIRNRSFSCEIEEKSE